jgi:hypothetical protein
MVSTAASIKDGKSTVPECRLLSVKTWSIRLWVSHQENSKCFYECYNVGTERIKCSRRLFFVKLFVFPLCFYIKLFPFICGTYCALVFSLPNSRDQRNVGIKIEFHLIQVYVLQRFFCECECIEVCYVFILLCSDYG